MVAVGGLHNAGQLAGLQLQRGLPETVHQGSGVVIDIAVGGGQRAVGVAAVLAVLLHQLVKEGLHVIAGLELGQKILGQGLLFRYRRLVQGGVGIGAVLLDGGGALGIHCHEQDVFDAENAVVRDILLQLRLGGVAGLGVQQVVVIAVHREDELHGLIGEAEQLLLVVIGLLAVGHHLFLNVGALLVGQGAAGLHRLLLQQRVGGGGVETVLEQLVGVALHTHARQAVEVDVLLQIGAVQGQQVRKQVGGDLLPVDGEGSLISCQAGGKRRQVLGEIGDDLLRGGGGAGISAGGGRGRGGGAGSAAGIGVRPLAGAQGQQQPGGEQRGKQTVFHGVRFSYLLQ